MYSAGMKIITWYFNVNVYVCFSRKALKDCILMKIKCAKQFCQQSADTTWPAGGSGCHTFQQNQELVDHQNLLKSTSE